MTSALDTLTPEQRAAACSDLSTTVVSACAGSGKTTLLAARVAYILGHSKPEDILCLVFTKSAAHALRERIRTLCGNTADRVQVRTFGSYIYELAKGVFEPQYRMATEAESETFLRSLFEGPSRVDGLKRFGINRVRDMLIWTESRSEQSGARMNCDGITIEDVMASCAFLGKRMMAAGLWPRWLVPGNAFLVAKPQSVPHVIIDEAQDITKVESDIALLVTGQSITYVGDPRQAIMGFRGGGTDVLDKPTHRLTHSFRFGAQIARWANRIAAMQGMEPLQCNPDLPEKNKEFNIASGTTALMAITNFEADHHAQESGLVRVRATDGDIETGDEFQAAWDQKLKTASTVHAMKGREVDTAILAFDPEKIAAKSPELARIAYVAITRARRKVIVRIEGNS